METTPDKYCIWKIQSEFLDESLGEIHRHGSTVIGVMPHELAIPELSQSKNYEVISYVVVYFNPAITSIPGMPGSGVGASVQ